MDIIRKLAETGFYSELDLHFGRFIAELSEGEEEAIVAMSAVLVSSYRQEGDVCLALERFAGLPLVVSPNREGSIICPGIKEWRENLLSSKVVGEPGERYPMILDEKNRLYLYRYWRYEKNLAELIKARTLGSYVQDVDQVLLKTHLKKYFAETDGNGTDWQMVAAVVAAFKRFCVISGGPGTGKTYAAAKILALILGQPRQKAWRVLLCAPTGKAAARLAQSISEVKDRLESDLGTIQDIPTESKTIHRMLKPVKGTPYFKYNAEHRLPADIVVVDEASMVDLPLMSKLIQAIPDDARLILMGDRDQLASVEAGSVLGDICGKKQQNGFSAPFGEKLQALIATGTEEMVSSHPYQSGIQDSILFFTKRYRFESGGGIHALSQAVNSGRPDETLKILKNGKFDEIEWITPSSMEAYRSWLRQKTVNRYRQLFHSADPEEMLACLDRFRVLCAVNQGPFGIHALNHVVESALQNKGLIRRFHRHQTAWYQGKPIMITENEYDLGLYNGDVGVACKHKDDGNSYSVHFKDSGEGPRHCRTSRLPAHHEVYAMTVHKSQGSEFDEVLIILPDKDSPLLTRELLYTGITRARQKLSILARESVIKSTVSRRIERASGLRDALWD
jgi:exodeoxyribonuclease V alpha subunit